jgi:hypothetical protein
MSKRYFDSSAGAPVVFLRILEDLWKNRRTRRPLQSPFRPEDPATSAAGSDSVAREERDDGPSR